MTSKNKVILLAGILTVFSNLVSSAAPPQMSVVTNLNAQLKLLAAALGVLMITYSGLRWIMADSPQERDDSKKAIVYVIIGLLVVQLAPDLVSTLYHTT